LKSPINYDRAKRGPKTWEATVGLILRPAERGGEKRSKFEGTVKTPAMVTEGFGSWVEGKYDGGTKQTVGGSRPSSRGEPTNNCKTAKGRSRPETRETGPGGVVGPEFPHSKKYSPQGKEESWEKTYI